MTFYEFSRNDIYIYIIKWSHVIHIISFCQPQLTEVKMGQLQYLKFKTLN